MTIDIVPGLFTRDLRCVNKRRDLWTPNKKEGMNHFEKCIDLCMEAKKL